MRQWLKHEQPLKIGNYHDILNKSLFKSILHNELKSLEQDSQVSYATDKLPLAAEIISEYVSDSSYQFLPDLAYKHIQDRTLGLQFTNMDLSVLEGSHPNLTGVELTKHRGEYLNKYLLS